MRDANTRQKLELEHHIQRDLVYGYQQHTDSNSLIRCIEHGAPHPLIRWHHHEEYELHLITSTFGKFFVGDYIGDFKPGNLVLTGPYLPHNWVSNDLPSNGVPSRDFSLQFANESFRKSCELLPELSHVISLLDRAEKGIEFFGISDFAKQQLIKIKNKKGIHSFNEFLVLITKLSTHSDYIELSSCQPSNTMDKFRNIVKYISENYDEQFKMTDIAEMAGMESTRFSRCFREVIGKTFTDYVNCIRISRACNLLIKTDQYISTIGYSVGYNTLANFNRRFVEIKKITPSEYRKFSSRKFSL